MEVWSNFEDKDLTKKFSAEIEILSILNILHIFSVGRSGQSLDLCERPSLNNPGLTSRTEEENKKGEEELEEEHEEEEGEAEEKKKKEEEEEEKKEEKNNYKTANISVAASLTLNGVFQLLERLLRVVFIFLFVQPRVHIKSEPASKKPLA
jgi:hypothetical protein